MKKVLLALCAVLMLTTACKKDDNQSPSGNGQGTEQPTTIPTGEGVFNPAQRIVSIMVDGVESEEWIWEDDMLNTIVTGAGETSTFEYNNYRVVTMYSSMEGMPFSVDYTYNGDKLATVAATSGRIL